MAGALEVHAAGLDDALIPGLSFTNRNTASYVTSRRSTSFQPVSGGVFSPSNLRIIRFSLQDCDGQWLDGSTLRLAFVVSNIGTQSLVPIAHTPGAMFARLRVLAGGVEVADIAEYGRTFQMFGNFLSAERRREDMIEGWGGELPTTDAQTQHMALSDWSKPASIAAGKKKRVLTQLLCPFFNNGKMLPLSLLGGLTLELEIGGLNNAFDIPGTSTNSWEILQPEILCDCIGLDPSLSSSFASHLLAGKTLPISYSNIFTMQTSLSTTTAVSIPISRGFSRLNQVYVTFTANKTTSPNDPSHPVVDFYGPLGVQAQSTDNDQFQASYQLGSVKGPVYNIRSIGECFYHLRKTLIMADGNEAMGITALEYAYDKFVLAFSFEKAMGTGAVHSGANTLAGQLLYLQLEGCGNATSAHITCAYDCVLSLTSGGNELAF